jgi:hypothetical protein
VKSAISIHWLDATICGMKPQGLAVKAVEKPLNQPSQVRVAFGVASATLHG